MGEEEARRWWEWYEREVRVPWVVYEGEGGLEEVVGSDEGEAEDLDKLPLVVLDLKEAWNSYPFPSPWGFNWFIRVRYMWRGSEGKVLRRIGGEMEVRLGLQSYSLRNFSLERSLSIASELGIGHLEVYPGHLPPEGDEVAGARELLGRYGIRMVAYGVVKLTGRERTLFEFAREMGVEVLSADPEPGSFPALDELVEEFGISVGIHNHGPGHRYASVEDVMKAAEGHHGRIGACLDTGHLVRAGEDPVEAVRAFGSRLHCVHLKDVDEGGEDVVVGTGTIDFERFFLALEEVNFRGPVVLEYELRPEDPVPGIRRSLEFVRRLTK